MRLDLRRLGPAAALAAALSFTGAPNAQAASVRLFVLAPQPPSTLIGVEKDGAGSPAFSKDLTIPYATLASKLTGLANGVLAKSAQSGHVSCTIPLPIPKDCSVDWSVSFSANISFPKAPQATLTASADKSQNSVDISVKPQMLAHLNIHVVANSHPSDVPIDIFVDIDGEGKLMLWPQVETPGVPCGKGKSMPACLTFTFNHSNLPLDGIQGLLEAAGAAVGFTVGFTPIGLGFGGPGPLSLLGDLLGSAAADAAKQAITDAVNKAIKDHIPPLQDAINAAMGPQITAGVTQANNVRDQVLNTKIPNAGNLTVKQAMDLAGWTFDVETTSPGGNVDVIATLRMAGTPGAGKISGKLRLPQMEWACHGTPAGTIYMPKQANVDLASKVGQACSAVLHASELKAQVYLGASPSAVQGGGANSLATWKAGGTTSFTGNLTATSQQGKTFGYYECGYDISSLPTADIVEISSTGTLATENAISERYFEASIAGQQIVLDDAWKPVTGSTGVLLVGGGPACTGTAGSGMPPPWWVLLKDKLDPEKCPACNITKVRGDTYVANPEAAFAGNPALKAQFETWLKNPSASVSPVITPAVTPAIVPTTNPKQGVPQGTINPKSAH